MEDKGSPEKPKNHDSLLIYDKIDNVRKEVKEDIKALDKKLDYKFNMLDNKIYGIVFSFALFAGGIVIKRYIRPKSNGKISAHLANNLK